MALKTKDTTALEIMQMEAYNSYNSANNAYIQIVNTGASEEIIEAAKATVEHRLKMYKFWSERVQDDVTIALKKKQIASLEAQLEAVYASI